MDRATLIHVEQQARLVAQRVAALRIPADTARALPAVVAAAVALRLLLIAAFPDAGFKADLATFAEWGRELAAAGPATFYRPEAGHFADYPPVYLFVLWISALLSGFSNLSPVQLFTAIKLPLVAADALSGIAIYLLGRELAGSKAGLVAATAFLFNPGVIFDSTIWGQNDSFAAIPVLFGLFLLVRGSTEAAGVASLLGLLAKFQYGFLVPVVGIVAVRRHLVGPAGTALRWRPEPRRLIACGVSALLAVIVVLWPFQLRLYSPDDPAHSIWQRFINATGAFSGLTQNAFNLWMNPISDIVIRGSRGTTEGHVVGDTVPFLTIGSLEITAQLLGNALFIATTIAALALVWRRPDNRWAPAFATLLIGFAFFMLPTRVHERYLFPAVALGPVFMGRGRPWVAWYAFVSLVFVLNLYWVYTLPLGNAVFERSPLLDATILSPLGIYALALGALISFVWFVRETLRFASPSPADWSAAAIQRRFAEHAQFIAARVPWTNRADSIVRRLSGVADDAPLTAALRSPPFVRGFVLLTSLLAALIAARVGGSGTWLWNPDMPKIDYPWASLFHEALVSGRLPLWNDRLGLGFPLYAEGQIEAFYPPNWLIFQLPPLTALDVTRVLHLTLAGLGTGLIALRLTGSRAGAVVAAATAVLCGGIVTKLEWTNAVVAYAWLPWVVLPLIRRPRPTTVGLVVSAVAWGIQALAGFPNLWVLTGLTAVVVMAATSPHLATLRRIAGWALLGGAVGAVQLIPTLVLTTLSVRSGGLSMDDLFNSAATPFDILGFAFANAFVQTDTSGWAEQTIWYPDGVFALFEVGAYVALPVIGLAAVGTRVRRARPLLFVVGVMLGIALIAAFRPALWAELPILNSMRSPVRAYLFADFALALLAAVGVSRLARDRAGRWRAAVAVTFMVIAYALFASAASLLPGTFEGLIRDFSAGYNAGQAPHARDLAVEAFGKVLPFAVELVIGGAFLALVIRGRRSTPILATVAALALLPLALFSPAANPIRPERDFTSAGGPFIEALRAQQPHRILTIGDPGWYAGMPNQPAGAGIADVDMFSSLNLKASDELTNALRANNADAPLLRQLVGIDVVVTFGKPCPGTPIGQVPEDHAFLCRVDALALPPLWIPENAVASVLATSGQGLFRPTEATVVPAIAVAGARPVTVAGWSTTDAQLTSDAPEAGWVFLDRAWWPAWRAEVDGKPAQTYRALGAQLVSMPAGRHVLTQRLVPWEALAGLALGLVALAIAVGYTLLERRPDLVRRWARRPGPPIAH